MLVAVMFAQCVSPQQPMPAPTEPTLDVNELSGFNTGQLDYGGIYQFFDLIGTVPQDFQDGSHNVIPWYQLEPTVGN